MFDSNRFTKEEKLRRNRIFRELTALLREESFSSEGKKLTDFLDINFFSPNLNQSKNFSALDDDEIYKLGVCAVPNRILNPLVCGELAKEFGDLTVCGCFFQIEGYWRLDVDEKLSRRGLLLPRRDKNGWIYGLQVFRYPDDPKPFFLKSRGQNFG